MEAQDGGDWGDPKWGFGDDQDIWAEAIDDQQSDSIKRTAIEDHGRVDRERLLGQTARGHR